MSVQPKSAILLLAALIVGLLSACQSQSKPSTNPSSIETHTQVVTPTPSPDPIGQNPEPIYQTLKQHFGPVPTPGPQDWLANHQESGQTYEQYRASEPNKLDDKRRVIYLLPLETFDEEAPSLDFLRRYTEAFFGLKVVMLEPPVDADFTSRTNGFAPVRQLLTEDILTYLKSNLPADAYCLLGITTRDLYPSEEWNYVFGIASLSQRVGVYSFSRYDPEFFGDDRDVGWKEKMLERSCKVLAHETAHMTGMAHCIFYDCLLNGSNHLGELDTQNSFLCPVCLRKLKLATRVDLKERYEKLLALYTEGGLTEQAQWLQRVLEE